MTYIADLVLRFLNSLHLWRACDHTETFSSILLKILFVANLQEKKHQDIRQKKRWHMVAGDKTQQLNKW